MSFIYEALKRAEDDNQQRVTAPVRAGAGGVASRARSRWWLWALIGVLAANALVIGAWTLVRGQRSPGDASPVAARIAAPTPNVVASAPRPPSVETPKPVPTIVPAPEAAPSAVPPPPAPPASVGPQPARAAVATPSPPSRAPAITERPTDRAAPARTASAPAAAPAITLQVLVYSETPAQRMVFIAGRRYAEGDAIDAETVLERINADGAVFRRRGQRFVISDRR